MLLAVPLAGYMVLLVSTVLGGPTVHTPLVPVPDAARHPGKGLSTVGPADRPAAEPTAAPTTVSSRASEAPTSRATPATLSTGTPSAAPTSVPASTVPTNRNRPTAPPGQARKPAGHTNGPTARPTKTPG